MPKAVFLDRDGTIIKDVHYLKDPKDIELIDGVGHALQKIKNYGYLLFLHTNQSGISRGYYDWDDVHLCNKKILELYKLPSDLWDGVCIAPESPKGKVLGYRKPSNKFQLEMISKFNLIESECWMVGDKWIDVETGLNSKMNAALVRTGKKISNNLEILAKNNRIPVCDDLSSFTKEYIV